MDSASHPTRKQPASTRYPFSVIREAIAKRDGVLDFAIGRHQLTPPPELLEFIHDHPDLAVRRSGPRHAREFAERAAEMLAREYGVQLTPDCVLLVPSGRAAISALVSCLLTPGDGVLVTVKIWKCSLMLYKAIS